MAATRPSIMSLGAIRSAPASACETAVRASNSKVASFTTSTLPARSRTTPQWPWEVYSHRQRSVITTKLGAAFFSARAARCTMPSSAQAPEPSASFFSGIPNRSTAGTPAASTRLACSASPSTDRWNWPGRDAISLRTPEPGTTNKGCTSDSRLKWCSRTMARSAGFWRRRRGRCTGNMPLQCAMAAAALAPRHWEMVGDEASGGGRVGERPFELGILDGVEHLPESRAGAVAPGDEILAADEPGRAQRLGRDFGAQPLRQLPQAEIAVAHGSVEAQELEPGFDIRQAQQPPPRALAHARQLRPFHVVPHQPNHLGGVPGGEAQAMADLLGDARADRGVAIEADAIGGAAEGGGLADIVQEHAQRQGRRDRMRQGLDHHQGVDPDVALGVVLRRLLHALHARHLGQYGAQQAGRVQELEAAPGAALGQHLEHLVANPLVADFRDLGSVAA